MLGALRARLRQGHRTSTYPRGPLPPLPSRFAGRPAIAAGACPADCSVCRGVCPTGAIARGEGAGRPCLDTGRCLFCRTCEAACPAHAIAFGPDPRLASASRQGLVVAAGGPEQPPAAFDRRVRDLFGRSLKLRQVSAGGCNACEADTNVLNTLVWDLGRFGIQFVAAPRHADGILVTGPVTANMALALRKTYEAVAAPKVVIAVGACAISGGLFREHAEASKGLAEFVPVDLFIPGCPPHPATILDGLLRWLGRIGEVPGAPAPRPSPPAAG